MIRHDSHVRSEWYPRGMSYAAAQRLERLVSARLADRGETPNGSGAHDGRRDAWWCDRVSPTRPAGWKAGHPDGAATIKIRGCDGFRAEARAIADGIEDGRKGDRA